MTDPADPSISDRDRPSWSPARALPLLVVLAIVTAVYATGWYRELSVEAIVRHRAVIVGLIAADPVKAVGLFAAIYVVATGVGLPLGMVMSMIGGLLFGIWLGGIVAVASATVGETILFLIARSAFGGHLLRYAGPRAAKLAEGFRANAFAYLFLLRMTPMPSWLINLVAAALNIELRTFVVASALGSIPLTFALAFIGNGLDDVVAAQAEAYRACLTSGQSECHLHFDSTAATTPLLLVAFGAICAFALIPLAVKHWCARSRVGASG